jgi:ribosomal protein S18 acetylase RimI-like enzyme
MSERQRANHEHGRLFTVRVARPDDYARVGELTVAAYRALPGDHLVQGYDEEIMDVEARAHDTEVLVAVDGDGNVLGACTFVTDPSSPWMEWAQPGEVQLRLLAVDPCAARRGVGHALVEAVIERATTLRRPIILHSTQHMTAAQRLYEQFGFVRVPERDQNDVIPGYEFRAFRWVPPAVTPAG